MLLDRLLEMSLKARGFMVRDAHLGGVRVHHMVHPGRRNTGPAIVLVHGIGSSSVHFHETLVRLVRHGCPLYTIDLPGHGGSSELPTRATPEGLLGVLELFLERVVGGPFVLVGNSLGGALVVRHAWKSPERVLGVLAASPALGIATEESWGALQRRLTMSSVADADRFVRSVFHSPPIGVRLLARGFFRSMNRPGVRELVSGVTVADFQPRETFGTYRVPTLVVWGRSERIFEPEALVRLKALLPDGVRFEEPFEIGHCPHLDSPSWFARRIVEFVDGLQAPRLHVAA